MRFSPKLFRLTRELRCIWWSLESFAYLAETETLAGERESTFLGLRLGNDKRDAMVLPPRLGRSGAWSGGDILRRRPADAAQE